MYQNLAIANNSSKHSNKHSQIKSVTLQAAITYNQETDIFPQQHSELQIIQWLHSSTPASPLVCISNNLDLIQSCPQAQSIQLLSGASLSAMHKNNSLKSHMIELSNH